MDDLIDLAEAFEVDVNAFIPPSRARKPVVALLRATVERLADSQLYMAIDQLASEAEAATLPDAELVVSATTPAYAANELIEKAGILEPPIDVFALCTRCGVLVLRRPFPDALSGLVFSHEGGAIIGVNTLHSDTRQRFSTAHELGHFILGHHERSRSYEDSFHIDVSEGNPAGIDLRAERAANEFAADLLMPRRFIAAEFEHSPNPAALASRFEVSELAMGYRLVNLGLR